MDGIVFQQDGETRLPFPTTVCNADINKDQTRPSHSLPANGLPLHLAWIYPTACLHVNAPSHRCFPLRFVPSSGVVPARPDLIMAVWRSESDLWTAWVTTNISLTARPAYGHLRDSY